MNAAIPVLDEPLRTLFERIADQGATGTPELAAIGAALAQLATDSDYISPWVERLGRRSGAVAIHAPNSGPRLLLVHRPEGGMSAVHDHGTWVAIATIVGTETHRRYRLAGEEVGARLELSEQRALEASDVVTLLPPDDIHDHGHLVGIGRPAHVLVLTGDDQTRFARREWELATGRQRVLRPGDGGRWLASQPMPRT